MSPFFLLFQDLWLEHKCLLNMGVHYFQLYFDPDASCRDTTPLQILYHNGKLNGFVIAHMTGLEGEK